MKYILIKNELIIPLDKIEAVKIHKSYEYHLKDNEENVCPASITIQVGFISHSQSYNSDEEAQKDFDAIREAIHESPGASLGGVRFL